MPTKEHKVRMTVDALHILELVAQDTDIHIGVRFGATAISRNVAEGGKGGDTWENELLNGFVQRLCAVDRRVREAKPTRKYSRAEVLAILDEIDPGKEKEGGAE